MQIITTTYLLYNYTLRLFVRTFNNNTQTIHRRKCKNSAGIWYWLKWLHILLLDDDAIRELPHASIVASRGWREPQPKRNRERKRRRTKFHCYQLNSSFWFLLSTDITIVLAFTHQHNVCVWISLNFMLKILTDGEEWNFNRSGLIGWFLYPHKNTTHHSNSD